MNRIYADLVSFQMERWSAEFYTIWRLYLPSGKNQLKENYSSLGLKKENKKMGKQWISPLRFWVVLLGLMLQYIFPSLRKRKILNYVIIVIHK